MLHMRCRTITTGRLCPLRWYRNAKKTDRATVLIAAIRSTSAIKSPAQVTVTSHSGICHSAQYTPMARPDARREYRDSNRLNAKALQALRAAVLRVSRIAAIGLPRPFGRAAVLLLQAR